MSLRSWLFILAAATVVLKLWLSAVFPVTGDEAYFIYWGTTPALGYYDHPPMVGWLLAALLSVSSAPAWLRLPVTLLPAFMALVLYAVLRRQLPRVHGDDIENAAEAAESRAAWSAIGFLLVPANVWNIFITTDTPLVFWSFLSGLAFWRAVQQPSRRAADGWFVLAGALLGLAFLSKYFAVLLGFAYAAYVVLSKDNERRWRGLALTFAAALPFVAVNLYWNYENCWANLMFNLYNRHDNAGWSLRTPLLYAVCLLYLLSPPALYWLARERGWWSKLRADASLRVLVVLAGVPLALFAVLSTFREVGLHWLLSFVPFFFAACAFVLPRRLLVRSALFLGVFSLIHVAAIAVAATQPLERWQRLKLYDGIVFHVRIADILGQVRPLESDYVVAADGYSAASVMTYYRMRGQPAAQGTDDGGTATGRNPYVFVFGEASSHARHDDLVTDFRLLQGKNIVVVRKSPPPDEDYRPYFDSVEYRDFDVAGVRFYLVLGRGFRYEPYREAVLDKVRERYYAIPAFLPQGHCSFCERYGPPDTCPVR